MHTLSLSSEAVTFLVKHQSPLSNVAIYNGYLTLSDNLFILCVCVFVYMCTFVQVHKEAGKPFQIP